MRGTKAKALRRLVRFTNGDPRDAQYAQQTINGRDGTSRIALALNCGRETYRRLKRAYKGKLQFDAIRLRNIKQREQAS